MLGSPGSPSKDPWQPGGIGGSSRSSEVVFASAGGSCERFRGPKQVSARMSAGRQVDVGRYRLVGVGGQVGRSVGR